MASTKTSPKYSQDFITPNPTGIVVTNPTNTNKYANMQYLQDMANNLVDEQAILDKFNAATTAQYNVQREQNRQAENQFYNQMYNSQQTAVDAIRQANAAAVSTGASRGIQAANELSALLGLQQESVASATELANANRQTAQEETAAVLENVLNAYQQAEQQRQNLITAGIQAASVDVESNTAQAQTDATNKQTAIAAYENGVEAGNAAAADIVDPNVPTVEGQALLASGAAKISTFSPDLWNKSGTGAGVANTVENEVKSLCSTYGLDYAQFAIYIEDLKETAGSGANWTGIGGTKTKAARECNELVTVIRNRLQNAYAAKLGTVAPSGPKHEAKK